MSARAVTVQQMDLVIRRREGERPDPQALGPDEMRLYAYYKPGLEEGNYQITATQTIKAPWNGGYQHLVVKNTKVTDLTGSDAPQEFQVVVPRFSLDPTLINSYYPPDGHQDEGRVLPHIVLSDPHYPWEILAGITDNFKQKIDWDADKKLYRSMVPWIALVVFDPEDLRFTDASEMTLLTKQTDLMAQNANGTFSILDDLKQTLGNASVIFPTKQQFKDTFAYDEKALEALKYLAHVRHINTTGFPDAGVEEEGLFSIVVSSRLGQFAKDQPQTQICHLVSIEHVDSTLGSWMNGGSERIGMISLFSWIYTALPPNPVNFVATVKNLVTNQQMLRIDDNIWQDIEQEAPKDKSTLAESTKLMVERLKQGYTMARWRTQSGEETAAFNRGPLVPGPVPWPVAGDIPDCSNTSQDYQIVDPQTGLMDLKYSSAWQLGKLLAISDTTFSAALMRFRSLVHQSSVHQTKMIASQMDPLTTAVNKVASLVSDLQSLSSGTTGDPSRFNPSTQRAVAPLFQDPNIKPLLQATSKQGVWNNATAGQTTDGQGQEIYNEFNLDKSNNTDWALVHSWLCEKLSLGGIPPQYLLPESAYLQPESLRFFHIDDFWLDCFIDGALSVANHLDSDDDTTRRQIKETFNTYLGNPVPRAGYKPQIPSYGFLIRSQLIKAMPDLRITVTWQAIKDDKGNIIPDDRASVCRWTKWDAETLLCLLDRQPEELQSIVLAQPPHQQRFSLGSYVGIDTSSSDKHDMVEFQLRRLYTTSKTPVEWPPKNMVNLTQDKVNHWLNFSTRVMRVTEMATEINNELQFPDSGDGEAYTDNVANSCELGLELNDPSYYFTIVPPVSEQGFQPTPATQRNRQLYVRTSTTPSIDQASQQYLKIATANIPAPAQPASKAPPYTPPPAPKPSSSPSDTTPNLSPLTPPGTYKKGQPIALSRLAPSFAKNNGPLTTISKLALTGIFVDYKSPPTRFTTDKYDIDDFIPTRNTYLFDLIFSIRRPVPSDYDLVRIDIDIPTGLDPDPSTDPPKPVIQPLNAKEPLLQSNYYGPGVRMLSNQRFTPFLFFTETVDHDTGTGYMHIELRPRSATDGYTLKLNDGKTAEMSFRLGEVPVVQLRVLSNVLVDDHGSLVQKSVGKAEVTMTEWYSTIAYPLGEPVSSRYQVIKRQVQEDKGWFV